MLAGSTCREHISSNATSRSPVPSTAIIIAATGVFCPHNMPSPSRLAVLLFWILVFISRGCGRTFKPQELAKELKELRVSEWEIPTLVCVAHNASGLTTNTTRYLHMTNIRQTMPYYGLFGFPEEWLEKCDLKKEQILDDDIHNDVNCLLMFLQTTDRKGALHHLTPGEVDLDKCLDWWDQLAPKTEPGAPVVAPICQCEAPHADYLTFTSLLILDAFLGGIAYLLYQLVRIQRRPAGDTISNFPLM